VYANEPLAAATDSFPLHLVAGTHLLQPELRPLLDALADMRPLELVERDMATDIVLDHSTSLMV
jgi:hypothetical protein